MRNKRGFSLTSLIIMLVVIGILVAVVGFVFGDNIRLKAYQAAYRADLQTIQTAVDAYYLDHAEYPSVDGQPSLGLPKAIDWDKLIPAYIVREPELDLYHWVDHQGQVWMAAYDAPINLTVLGNTFQWQFNDGPAGFQLFQGSSSAQAINKAYGLTPIDRVGLDDIQITEGSATFTPDEPIDSNGQYYMSAYGSLGVTPPVGFGYTGHPSPPKTDWSWLAPRTLSTFSQEEVSDLQIVPGDTVLHLTWSNPNNPSFKGVRIWWKEASAQDYGNPIDLDANATSYTIDNLVNGVLYDIKVSTLDSHLNVSAGVTMTASPGDMTFPAEVANLAATPGDGKVTFTWTDPLDPELDAIIITWTPGNGSAIIAPGVGQYVVTGLTNNVDYTFAIRTRDSNDKVSQGLLVTIAPVPTSFADGAAGYDHSLALKSDGTVLAWGMNSYGQLGVEGMASSTTPVEVQGLTEVVVVAAGYLHSLALKSDGTVWAWGLNNRGQLGDGTTNNSSTPVQVQNLTDVIAVAANYYRSMALKEDGTVWSWGWNFYGQLGDGTTEDRHIPVQVAGLTNVLAIAAGYSHAIALKDDGTVWAWGAK